MNTETEEFIESVLQHASDYVKFIYNNKFMSNTTLHSHILELYADFIQCMNEYATIKTITKEELEDLNARTLSIFNDFQSLINPDDVAITEYNELTRSLRELLEHK